MGDDEWRLGVLGLTANRVVEKYERSVVLYTNNHDGMIKGSVRTDGTVETKELLEAGGGDDFFADFGGHAVAGGFSLNAEKLPELLPRLEKSYKELRNEEGKNTELLIEEELKIDDVNWGIYTQIEKLAPYGMGNPKPNFLLKSQKIEGVKEFGNGGIHLELVFKREDGKELKAIGFFMNMESWSDINLNIGHQVDVVVAIERSTFRGFPELRMRIVDIRQSE